MSFVWESSRRNSLLSDLKRFAEWFDDIKQKMTAKNTKEKLPYLFLAGLGR